MRPDVAAETGESSQAEPEPATMDSCEASNSCSDGSAGDSLFKAEHTKTTGSGRNKRKSADSGEESHMKHPRELCGPKQTRFEADDSMHSGVAVTPEGTVQMAVTLPPGLPFSALASSQWKSSEAASGTIIGKLPITGEINFKISSGAGSSSIDTASQLPSPAPSQEMFDNRQATASQLPSPAPSQEMFDNRQATASQLQSPAPSQEMSDNKAAVVALRVFRQYIYLCFRSNASRHNHKYSTMVSSGPAVKYMGQGNKELISLEVCMIQKETTDVYLIAKEGMLSCYDADTGDFTGSFPVAVVVTSSVLAWGHIYLGLGTGEIVAFNIKLKKMDLEKGYSCFEEREAVACIRAVDEHKQRLLYAISAQGNIVVYGESTGENLWKVDTQEYVPTVLGIKKGCIYVTTPNNRMCKLQKGRQNDESSFWCAPAVVGIYFYNKYIIYCSCDGKIWVYHMKNNDLECMVVYYGAGKKDITCMDVTGNLVATGNSEGSWDVVKIINMTDFHTCKRCSCNLRFPSEEDRQYHNDHEHNGGR